MKKKTKKIVSTSLLSLLMIGVMPSVSSAAEWHAKAPSEIGNLASDGTYTVQNGDTLWAIGIHFNSKPSVLEKETKISNPYLLRVGTKLKIHVDKDHDQAFLETVRPDGTYDKIPLKDDDKMDSHRKFGEDVLADMAEDAKRQNVENKDMIAEGVSDEQLAFMSYLNLYDSTKDKTEKLEEHHFVIKQDTHDKKKYYISAPDLDISGIFTISGDTISYEMENHHDGKKKAGHFSKVELLDKYYKTDEQKTILNNAVENATTN